ncbi:MAG: hypothetical protein ACRDH6_08615 [Actinomycetota bacterium]
MAPKRPGGLIRLVERVVLGVGMTIAAIIVERRLLKALRKSEANGSGAEGERGLAAGPEQIEDQPRG